MSLIETIDFEEFLKREERWRGEEREKERERKREKKKKASRKLGAIDTILHAIVRTVPREISPPCRHSHITILSIQRDAYGCHSPASSHGDV